MKLYLISDTHFFHKNIQKYCNRPDNWQELIVNNWNSIITSKDVVLHLGDFALGSRENFIEIRKRLNGNIVMIRGNHDQRSLNFYEENNILIVNNNTVIKDYIFSHRPIMEDFPQKLNIHGHTHNNNIGDSKHLNVSVENINYTPIHFDSIEKWEKII